MDLEKLMSSEDIEILNAKMMSPKQRDALFKWGMKMFSLGRHVVSRIEDIKYDGRLIILEDGSRWEVDTIDASTAETWSAVDDVVVIEDKMYNLENAPRVDVKEESF